MILLLSGLSRLDNHFNTAGALAPAVPALAGGAGVAPQPPGQALPGQPALQTYAQGPRSRGRPWLLPSLPFPLAQASRPGLFAKYPRNDV